MTRCSGAACDFAQWLAKEHADIYGQLYAIARDRGVGNVRFGSLGDDISPDTVTVSTDTPVADTSYSPAAPIQDVGTFDPNMLSTPTVDASPSGTTSGGGFLDALSSVGQWLVSPQGLTSIAQVGTAVLKVQQSNENARVQMAVIQGNAARAAAGKPVMPITYTTNANGQLVPVYDAGTMSLMPPEINQAIAQGRAHEVVLPDGSTGYTLDPSTLNSVLSTGLPLWVWVVLGSILLAAVV